MKFLKSTCVALLTLIYLGFITSANANDSDFQWGRISSGASCGGTYGRAIDSDSDTKTPRDSASVSADANCISWRESDTWGRATQSYNRTTSGGRINFDASAKSSYPPDGTELSLNSTGSVSADFSYRLDIGFREQSIDSSNRPVLVELSYSANLNAEGYVRDLTCTANCSKTTNFSMSGAFYRSFVDILSINDELTTSKTYAGTEYIEYSYTPSSYSSRTFTVNTSASAANRQAVGLQSSEDIQEVGLSRIGGTVDISFSVNHPDVECFYVRLPDDEPFTGCDLEPATDSVYDILDRMRLAQCANVELAERAKLVTDPIGALLDKLVEKELVANPVVDAAGVAKFLGKLWTASNNPESFYSLKDRVMLQADAARNLFGAISSIQCSQFDRHGLTEQPDIQPPSATVPGEQYDPGIADSDGPENQPVDVAFSNFAKGIGSLAKGGSIAKRILEQERNGVPPSDESEAELELALTEADEKLAEAAEDFDQAGGGLRERGVDLAIDQDSIALAVDQLEAGVFDEAYFLALANALGFSEEEARALLIGFPDLNAPNLDPDLQGRDAFEVLAELARNLRPAASQVFPKIILKPNQWYQIALPGPIDAGLTVNDLFGKELDPLDHDSKWVLFSFDPSANKYVNLGLDGIMEQGVGYWIFQITDMDVELSIPDSRYSTLSPPDSDCVSLRCFSNNLTQSEGAIVWNMSGYPFAFERPSKAFVVASTEGVCADGCSVDQAFNENLVGPQLWHYDASTGGYEQLNGDNRFQPWDGFWIAVQPSVASSGAGTIQAKIGAP